MEDSDEGLGSRVAAEVSKYGEVRPPWTQYPDLPRYSLGWRMGAGEDYLLVWWEWWHTAFNDLTEKCGYFRRYDPPLPWLDWIALQLWPDRDDYETGVQELERMGVGNFAEWKAWMDSEDAAEPS